MDIPCTNEAKQSLCRHYYLTALVVMLCLGWPDGSDSPGLGHDLTAAFVTELEQGPSTSLGYNVYLYATITHCNPVQLEHNLLVCIHLQLLSGRF